MEKLDLYKPIEGIRELSLLQELEKNPVISQRELSHKFGIALGVTNACLKRMVRRGWIQIVGMNHRRISYYLTPKGFSEKAKLTFQQISHTVHHYSELKRIIRLRFLEMEQDRLERIVFYGISDEMEIAYVTLQGVHLKLAGIVEDDEKCVPQILFGFELEPVSRIKELKPDCVLITTLAENESKRQKLKDILGGQDIRIKDICPY